MLMGMEMGSASVEVSMEVESRVRHDGLPLHDGRPKQKDQGYVMG